MPDPLSCPKVFLAPAAPPVDMPARVLAVVGLVVAIAGVALTFLLWYRSGPRLRVTAFTRGETGTIHIEIASTGRLAATVRRIEIRDRFVLQTTQGETQPTSTWIISVDPSGDPLPRNLAPTEFMEADIDVRTVLERAGAGRDLTVQAWVQRGDGHWDTCGAFRVR